MRVEYEILSSKTTVKKSPSICTYVSSTFREIMSGSIRYYSSLWGMTSPIERASTPRCITLKKIHPCGRRTRLPSFASTSPCFSGSTNSRFQTLFSLLQFKDRLMMRPVISLFPTHVCSIWIDRTVKLYFHGQQFMLHSRQVARLCMRIDEANKFEARAEKSSFQHGLMCQDLKTGLIPA